MRRAVVYALFDKDPVYAANIVHFLRFGVQPNLDHSFFIVVNGKVSPVVEAALRAVADRPNVRIDSRPNTGFDFGAFGHAVHALGAARFDQYIFLNSSVRGPYVPRYVRCWVSAFTSLLSDTVKLVGPTINPLKSDDGTVHPHVQSYAFATDFAGFGAIVAGGIFTHARDTFLDVIQQQEVRMSTIIRQHPGWTIACFVPEFAALDFRMNPEAERKLLTSNPDADITQGDIVFPGALCFGRDLTIFEVMFAKTNRNLFSAAALDAATKLLLPPPQ